MRLPRGVALLLLASSIAAADPSGKKWFKLPVPFRIAASVDNTGASSINGGIAYSTVVGRTQAAFTNWGKSKVTNCPGPTTWDTTYSGTFASPSGLAMISSTDKLNTVAWLTGSSFSWGTSTLGITFTQYFPSTGELDEADMAMNNNVPWSDLCGGAFNSYDYESVLIHEAGHFLGLDHSAASVAVMYASVANGQCKRALQTGDTGDVCTVYPGAVGSQGSPCSVAANCTSTGAPVCRSQLGTTSGICTSVCTTSATCTTGYTCQNAQGGGMACLPQLGAPDLCRFCSSGTNCSTGQCVTADNIHTFCSATCSGASCGAGYTCMATMVGGLCAPTSPCSNQCTGTGQQNCPVGYTCLNGLCDPVGNIGDRCEISGFCKPCARCIGTDAEAYCRACCGGTEKCNNCPNAACSAGNSCVMLNASTDKVCISSTGAALCTSCDAATPCLNGATCLAGRCHLACNPSSPGSCGACLDQGGTNGACACSDEVATVNGVCGVQPNGGFFACQSGLACAGAPATCKRPCTLGNNATCSQGEQCQAAGAQAVCVPAPAGLQCSACSLNGTACAPGLTCSSGRCYLPCNTNATTTCGQPGTQDCVQLMGDGTGVCTCSDQKAGVDQPCGTNPIKSCQLGLKCIGSFCRSECQVTNANGCSVGLECRVYLAGATYCQAGVAGTGGGGGASCVPLSQACSTSASCCSGNCASGPGGTMVCQPAPGGSAGGGDGSGGGGTSTNSGCGCGAGFGGFAVWPLLTMVGLGLRRRKQL